MKLNISDQTVTFVPTCAKDIKAIKEHPLLPTCSRKYSVVQNIIDRLRLDIKIPKFELKPLPPEFKFHTPPFPHQEIGLRFLLSFGGGGLLAEPGLGKTKMTLDYIYLMKFKRAVIVAPKPLIDVWIDEAAIHRPELALIPVTQKADDIVYGKEGLYVMSYAKFRMTREKLMAFRPEFLTLDEALILNGEKVTVKNKEDGTTSRKPSSLQSYTAWEVGQVSNYRSLASGTLVNNSVVDLYSPIRFLEPALVGRSISKFKERYLVIPKYGPRYFAKTPRNIEELKSVLASCSIVMRKDDWLKDLPKKQRFTVQLPFPEEQSLLTKELISNRIAEVDGYLMTPENPLTLMSIISQISCGFVYKENKVPYYFSEQPKIKEVIRRMKEQGRKAIVWFNYSAEGRLALRRFQDAGLDPAYVDGTTKDVKGVVREFNQSSRPVLLAQSKVLNYGQTILGNDDPGYGFIVDGNVFTEHFLSESYSYATGIQQEDRVHRIGTKFPPEYYRYLSSPLDYDIRDTLEKKKDVSQDILKSVADRLKIQLKMV